MKLKDFLRIVPESQKIWLCYEVFIVEADNEAMSAVRDYMVNECLNGKDGKIRGGYEWTRVDGKKVLLMVEVVDGGKTDD